jgi:hypothetical protein
MTVREMIEELKKYPPDFLVGTGDDMYGMYTEIYSIEEDDNYKNVEIVNSDGSRTPHKPWVRIFF